MGVSKVLYGDNTVIDLTADTVKADCLRAGYTAHGADGELITGMLKTAALEPYISELNCGYITNGTWMPENPTKTYVDIYEVKAGHIYFLTLGENVGTRFRAMFSIVDVSNSNSRVSGSNVINLDNPEAYSNVRYTAQENGYIAIGKDNIGKTGVKTYLYDVTEGWK